MKQFSIRGLLTGIIGLLLITSSSMYVALRMGALPWPTIFVTVLSMTILGKTKNVTLQEINVTHTLMSSGAMVAGGVAFTIPGIWILNPEAELSVLKTIVVVLAGAVSGTVFSSVYRKTLIEEQKLVFPIGKSAYTTLITGIEKSRQSLKLVLSMVFSIAFTMIRDVFNLIPSVLVISKKNNKIPQIDCWISPMALAIGAIIDKISAVCWFLGAVVSCFVLSPLGASDVFRQNVGIGMIVGTGIAALIKMILKVCKKQSVQSTSGKQNTKNHTSKTFIVPLIVIIFCAVLLSTAEKLTLTQTLTAIVLTALCCLLSGILTGQSGVNPMEIFGIITMLAVGAIKITPTTILFLTASFTAVACGLSGDVMNDFKSGHMLNTDVKSQVAAESVGAVISAVLSVIVLFAMKKSFGNFGTSVLPAPQAKAVASMASGFGNSTEFFVSIAIGTLLSLAGIPSAPLGLGIYLSMQISLPVGIGALTAYLCRKNKKITNNDVNLVSSGLLGGEGIAGVVIAIFSMF